MYVIPHIRFAPNLVPQYKDIGMDLDRVEHVGQAHTSSHSWLAQPKKIMEQGGQSLKIVKTHTPKSRWHQGDTQQEMEPKHTQTDMDTCETA